MAQSLQICRIVARTFLLFAISINGICAAQSTYTPLSDTPSQRWLPPVRSYPEQPDQQAKLLSQLRGLMQKSDDSNDLKSSRLSDSEVQSLKDAMKQFDGNWPDGLSADSLDAIPSDLISKALSNPELMRQAKELAEQFSNGKLPNSNEGKKSNDGREKNDGSNSASNNRYSKQNDLPKSKDKPDDNESLNSGNKQSQPVRPKGRPESNTPSSSEDFADLMEKLRSTQQQYENKQTQQSELPSSPELSSPPGPVADSSKEPLKPGTPLGSSKQGKPSESGAPGSKSSRPASPGSSPSRPTPTDRSVQQPTSPIESSNPFDSKRSSPATQRKKENDIVPPRSAPDSTKQELSRPTSPSPRGSRDEGIRDSQGAAGINKVNGTNKADEANVSDATSPKNIRQELDRKGFGPTLQKLIEDAQRAGQAARVAPVSNPPPTNSIDKRAESKNQEQVKTLRKNADPKNADPKKTVPRKPEQATKQQTSQNVPRPAETPPRPPQPDSAFSKGLKQTGKAINDFWTQISKSESSAAPTSSGPRASPPAASAPSTTNELSSLPNPFSARVLQGLLVLAVAIAIGFFALRHVVRTEQARREIEEAKMAPKIDEIRTRDDVVRAFHAMTKHRFQSAQMWWTSRHVAERFEQSLPEYTAPIRTLSSLYEQARYFPKDHQLSSDQIEDAKLALKQCNG